jgi:hypothetical protein
MDLTLPEYTFKEGYAAFVSGRGRISPYHVVDGQDENDPYWLWTRGWDTAQAESLVKNLTDAEVLSYFPANEAGGVADESIRETLVDLVRSGNVCVTQHVKEHIRFYIGSKTCNGRYYHSTSNECFDSLERCNGAILNLLRDYTEIKQPVDPYEFIPVGVTTRFYPPPTISQKGA